METPSTSELAILRITGEGYGLKVTKEAQDLKLEVLEAAQAITVISCDAELAEARGASRRCVAFRTGLEASRKEVKAIPLEVGNKIDAAAQAFGAAVLAEESRLNDLGKAYVAAQAKAQRAEAEEKQRIANEAAKKAQAEAEAIQREQARVRAEQQAEAAKAGAEVRSREEAIRRAQEDEARRIESEREATRLKSVAEAAVEEARNAVAAPSVAGGKMEWDYAVEDIHALYAFNREFVELTVRRSVTLRAVKAAKAAEPTASIPGLRLFEEPKLSR